MSEKLTIHDIARLAGVSKATVSRVLNHRPDVNQATRERILQLMDEHGFVPSITASGLAGGRPRMIGVLVPALTWHFIPEIVQGVAEAIEHSPYELILYSIAHEEARNAMPDRILDTKLTAGLLAVAPGQSAQRLTQLYEQGFPVVLIDDQGLPTAAPWVGVDNRTGASAAVRHLISLGHQRIAHIQGPAIYQCSLDRAQGYQQALAEANLSPNSALILQGDFTIASGRACAETLFTMPERPTAIFAANDHMAWGILEVAEERGLRVPEDVAVVGFDDTAPSIHKRPPLTTVRQPFHAMGQRAGELLLWLVDSLRLLAGNWQQTLAQNKPPLLSLAYNEPIRIQLETELIVRESCGAHRLAPASGL